MHGGQATIFDAIAAEELAQAGIAVASRGKNALLERARGIAETIALTTGRVTADDVIREMLKLGYHENALGNAAGAIFRGGRWTWDGTSVVKSERTASHGRLIRVWRLK